MKIPSLRHDVDRQVVRRSGLAFEHGHERIAVTRVAKPSGPAAFDKVGVRQGFGKRPFLGVDVQL